MGKGRREEGSIGLGMAGAKGCLVTSWGVLDIGMIPWDKASEGVRMRS